MQLWMYEFIMHMLLEALFYNYKQMNIQFISF
jgi:hypothetical protein